MLGDLGFSTSLNYHTPPPVTGALGVIGLSGRASQGKVAEMDRRYPNAAVVKKMKDGARASPWIPVGVAPRERYHHLPDGLSLCLTVDILPKEYVNLFAKIFGVNPSEELGEGGKFWHLSIARMGGRRPTPEEVEFWRRAFFEEDPIMEMQGLLPGVNASHSFWRFD